MRCYTLDNETTTNQDITNQLEKLLNEVQHHGSEQEQEPKEDLVRQERVQKIDVLNLPPRKEVHSKTKLRTRIKFGKETGRLFVVLLILIVLITGVYAYWGNGLKEILNQFFKARSEERRVGTECLTQGQNVR